MNVDVELMKILKKIRNRMSAWKTINYLISGIAISSVCGLLLALVSRFLPIYNVYFIIIITSIAFLIIFAAVSIIKKPNYKEAALKADSLGLNERSITAVELIGSSNSFALIQKQDALNHLETLDYKKYIKFKPNIKICILGLLFITCIGISSVIPNKMTDKANALHKISKIKSSEVKKIDNIEKQIAKNNKISDFSKEDIKNKLEDLKKEVKSAQNEKDINKEIEKADKKIELAKQQYVNPDLKSIQDALSKNSATKPLADAIKNLDEKQLKEQIKKVSDNIKNLTDDQKKELSKNLSDLSKTLKDNPDLAKAMSDLSQKIANGDLGDVNNELSDLQKNVSDLMKDENIKNAMADAQKQLSQSSDGKSSSQQSNNDNGTVSSNSSSENNSSQQGNGQNANGENGQSSGKGQNGGQDSGNGQGNGNGKGNGGGQGNGGGGSGAGTGTGMSDSGPSSEAQAGSSGLGNSSGSSQKKTGDYEKVYAPKNLGGQSDKSNITGKKNSSGSTQTSDSDQSLTESGESVSYDKVVGDYSQKAYQSMNNSDIPDGMKDVVKNYFTSLGQ